MKRLVQLFSLMSLVLMFAQVDAQVKTPAPSPASTLTQTVGLSEVTIEYSRPSMKDRTIFGGLVPYGEMWRTGANGSTDITFSDDVMVAGNKVEAGKYALYATPNQDEWTFILYKNTEIWGTPSDEDFKEEDVAAKFMAKPQGLPYGVETFTIGINNLKSSSADVMLYWEKTMVSFPIEFGTDEMVMEGIKKTMSGPSANDYYRSARYYLDSGKDLKEAHGWITKATEMREDAFWMHRIKSQIEANMGEYKMAIASATKSKMLAEKAGNMQYVKYNEEAIKEWSMK